MPPWGRAARAVRALTRRQPAWQTPNVQAAAALSSAASPPSPAPLPLAKLDDSFAAGTAASYLEELEARWRESPASVDKSWASFFRLLGAPPCNQLTPLQAWSAACVLAQCGC